MIQHCKMNLARVARLAMTLLLTLMTSTPAWAQSVNCQPTDIGKVLGMDGKVYTTVSAAGGMGSVAGMIAYVNTSTHEGIAIGPVDLFWNSMEGTGSASVTSAINACSNYDRTRPSAATTGWRLPSQADYNNMIGSDGCLSADNLRNMKGRQSSSCGVYAMANESYWSSTQTPGGYYYNLWEDDCTAFAPGTDEKHFRPCFTFRVTETYTISYNANGGSGTVASQTKWQGTDIILASSGFTRTGYALDGWALSSGANKKYNLGETFTGNGNLQLYAHWVGNTYYVRFNKNASDATGSMSNETFTYGTAKALTSNAFSRTGYTFAGWNTKANGTGTNYSNGQSVNNLTATNGATVDLYAKWTQASVSYRAYNTGTNTFQTLTANSYTAVTSSTTTMGAANTETWYVVSSNVTVSSSRIEVLGTVNLILADGKSMTAEKGLHVPSGVTLNIYGQSGGTGQLHSFSNTDKLAGIGGNNDQASGIITIHGGSIEAIGAFQSAGIGGGRAGNGGTTTIYGGTVNATGGNYGAGVGGGVSGNGGTVTIIGGTVIANAGTVDANDNSQSIGKGAGTGSGGTLIIDGIKVYSSANASNPVAPADRESICQSKYAKLMPCTSHNFVNGVCTLCGSTPDVDNPRAYLAYQTATQTFVQMEATNPTFVTGSTTTFGADNTETWYSVNNNVTVSSRIEVRGTVHLILCDGKTLTASQGITVNSGNTLNIYGQSGTGALNATGTGSDGTESAAIGSTGNAGIGSITIHGGRITANGASWSAGIGGGINGGGGSVTIYGGTVNATGHDGNAEAIGHGSSGTTVTKTLADRLRVTTNNNSTPVAYDSRVSSLGQQKVKVEPCTEHLFSNKKCTYCGETSYRVTYDGNTATSGTAPTDATDYELGQAATVLGNTGNLAITGYSFAGWNTAADGSGTNYAPGATFTINGDITLYAQWTPITYTVRFHKNDGSGVYSDQTFTYNSEQALAANAFTRDGWYFVGWSIETNGSLNYTDGQSIINLATEQDAVVNLYALWVQAIYTISYDLAGGTVATPNPTTFHEYSSDITLVNPTRKGYSFIGWTGTGLAEPTKTVTIPSGSTGNREYTANWEGSVDYLAYNTTTHLFEAQSLILGNNNTVTDETTSMSNGWYIVDDDVSNSNRITVTGTVNLIILDGKTLTASNGITVSSGNTLNIYSEVGGTGTLVASVTGTTNNAAIGSVGNVNNCGTISIHGGIITANGGPWSAGIGGGVNRGGGTINIYGGTVTANGQNAGSQAIGKGSAGYGAADVTRFIADGLRVFVGSNTTPVGCNARVSSLDNGSVRIEPCTEHNYSNNKCTYCGKYQWYTVTYNGNGNTGGSVPTDNTHYATDGTGTVTVLGNTGALVRTGYTFTGWNTAANGSGTAYAADATFTIYNNVTLYAQWTPITYIVRFHNNHDDATGTMDDQTFTYDVAQALTPNAFTRDGYTIVGWSTTTDGAVTYTDGQSVTNLANVQDDVVNLYAKWTELYTITYDLAGGTADNPTSYTTLSEAITLINPTREGYTFAGWTGTDLDEPTTTVTIAAGSTGDRAYTATWTLNTYTIAYDLAGGTVATPNPTSYSVENDAITLVNPTRTDYTFVGWTGTGLAEPTMTVTIPAGSMGNREYTATWIMTFWNNTDNSAIIAETNGTSLESVLLAGRTLYRDGSWNTLCLPFDVTISGSVLDGATVKTLTSSDYNSETGTLTLNFSEAVSTIEAGVPYIIKWEGRTVDLSTLTADYTAQNGDVLTGTLGGNYKISIAAGARVTLDGATINGTSNTSYSWAGISCIGNATIILKGTNAMKGFYENYPGIHVPSGSTLTIQGSGSLNARSNGYGAGIGGGYVVACGNIVIEGGNITATGGNTAAGIGSGINSACGNIEIKGGNITVTGGLYAAGIGSGNRGSCGTITIADGVTSVTATKGSVGPNSIGAGYNGSCGTVTIGGVVTGNITTSPYTYTGNGTGSASGDIVNPVFTDVTIKNTTANVSTTYADFNGSYAPLSTLNSQLSTLLDAHNTDGDAMHAAISIATLPEETGYTFVWCTDVERQTAVTTIPFAADGSVTLYGTWAENYTISYDLDGGTADNPTTYTALSEDITLVNPTLDGYVFAGWTGTDLSEPTMTVTIAHGSTGNRAYTATWIMAPIILRNNTDNSEIIAEADGKSTESVTLADRTLYRDGDWNTLVLPFDLDDFTGTPLEGATVKTLTSTDFNDGTLTMNFSDDLTSIEAGKPYIVKWDDDADLVIRSASDWYTFADNVASYDGKMVKLAADISVSQMVGGTFHGTLDGCGHTITVSLSSGGSAEQIALFNDLGNATIKNLKIAGTISFGKHRPASFASYISGTTTIMNCWSSVAITSNYNPSSADWVDGGAFVARVNSGATINMSDCLFTGSITYNAKNNQGGGMVGWTQGSNSTVNLTHCLFAPSSMTMTATDPKGKTYVFVSGEARGNLSGCYYNSVANNVSSSVLQKEGTYTTATGESLRALLGDGWEMSGGNVVPKMIPGIVNPVFSGVTIDATARNQVCEFGDGKSISFVGTYSPVVYNDENKSVLFLGGGNSLYYPDGEAPTTVNACRAYFTLNGITAGDPANPQTQVKSFKLNFGDGDITTSLRSMENGQWTMDNGQRTMENEAGAWYDMSGRRIANNLSTRQLVNSSTLKKGIYIHNGKKVAVK